ncbi:hypothetical protein [Maioricimonas rarisocia]|uniref:hypothetical protein n=1 Tax=Maioricimonas rarisocia TaxID=2528026 RepID=UPI0018D23995|nr:hypothetical protein [Maioricimonas rarisocia]
MFAVLSLVAFVLTPTAIVRGQDEAADTSEAVGEDVADPYDRSQERTWTDRQGRQQKAKFSGVLSGNVLLKVGGRIQRIPLATLSDEDVDWIREVLRREDKLDQLPFAYREKKDTATMPATGTDTSPSDATTPAEESYDRNAERVWTDSNGKQVTGTYFSLFREDVQIKVTGSGVVRVPLANLSASDIDWVREYLRRNNQLNRLPLAYRLSPDDPAAMQDPEVVPQAGLRDERIWTDRKGNKARARFFSISGKDLKLTGRGFTTLPLAQLSRDDLIWLQDALKEEGRLHEMPLAYRDPPDESLSELELARHRRTGYLRKWTQYNGKSFVATYVRVSDGEVQLYDGSQQRGFPWYDLSDEDQEYVRARLEREIAGAFFPEKADIVLTTDEIDNGWRLWTDLDERQVKGRYVKRDHGLSVAVLETPDGEQGYIFDFLGEEDREYIDAETKRRIEAEKARREQLAAAARQEMENRRNSRPSSPFPTSRGMGPHGAATPPTMSEPRFPEPQFPEIVWVYSCMNCGAEFTEDDGVKAGDPCPRCNRQTPANRGGQQVASNGMTTPQAAGAQAAYNQGYQTGQLAGKVFLAVCGIVAIVFVIQKASGK